MGSLVYLWLGLKKSPYCHLLDNSHWAKICETFTFDACSLLEFSMEWPLSIRYSQRVRQHEGEAFKGNNLLRPCYVPGMVLSAFTA